MDRKIKDQLIARKLVIIGKFGLMGIKKIWEY